MDVFHRLLKCCQPFYPVCFVECKVGLVGYAVWCCCINNLLIEREDRVFLVQQVCGHFVEVNVQSYAEEALLLEYLSYKFFSCHYLLVKRFVIPTAQCRSFPLSVVHSFGISVLGMFLYCFVVLWLSTSLFMNSVALTVRSSSFTSSFFFIVVNTPMLIGFIALLLSFFQRSPPRSERLSSLVCLLRGSPAGRV